MSDDDTARELIDELHALLRDGEEESLRIFLRLARPEDVAEWLDPLSAEERQRIFTALDHETAGSVLTDTTASIRSGLMDELPPERLARIAVALPADDAADLIGELEDHHSEQVLSHIADPAEEVLRHLLTYPDDTAGGIMTPDVVALRPQDTVDDAIGLLRTVAETTPIAALYVVDDHGRLLGFVRMRRLVTAPPTARLGDIMSTDVISVRADTDQEDVADLVDKYDFMAVPVVDANHRLLGAVTVDDVLDVIEEEATEDIYKLAGSSAEEEESESVLHVARYRLPWLLVCLAGTQLSSSVLILASRQIGVYEQLSVFTASIMAMAGNTSLQSSTTTIRRLALDTLPRARYARHVLREIAVAFLMGMVCGSVAAAAALAFDRDPVIGLALGAAMAVGMSAASLLGTAMPLILDLAAIDPAVASGPLVSTVNDSLALGIYFAVATGFLLLLS